MYRSTIAALFFLAAPAMAVAGKARSTPVMLKDAAFGADIASLTDKMALAKPEDHWRISSDPYLQSEDEEDIQIKVKLRPNRAMGRVSLSF